MTDSPVNGQSAPSGGPKRLYSDDSGNDAPMTTRDHLAVDRTILAHERTFLAYLQSFLTMFAAGIALIHLPSLWIRALGWVLMPASLIMLTVGIMRRSRERRLVARFKRDGMQWPD